MKLIKFATGFFRTKSNDKLTYKKIKKQVDNIADLISAPTKSLPTYGYSRDMAFPHIEIDRLGRLHYVVIERGQENERLTTTNLDELLYWIFYGITFSMACEYELKNRIEENQDFRRVMFAKQEELLGIINPLWKDKHQIEHQRILEKHPFDDFASSRATYCGQLRKQGLCESEIDKLAYEKYPENKKYLGIIKAQTLILIKSDMHSISMMVSNGVNQPPNDPRTKRATIPCFISVLVQLTRNFRIVDLSTIS